MTSPHRLVVVGNGMAGARLVEDVLARANGDRFDITMFGDEPYGNYNRILLSGVLAGAQQPEDIFINPLDWYADNGVTLHAGVRRRAIDRDAQDRARQRRTGRRPTTRWCIATGSVPFVPPLEGLRADRAPLHDAALQARRLRLPHARGLRAHAGRAPRTCGARRSSAAACSGSKRRAASRRAASKSTSST